MFTKASSELSLFMIYTYLPKVFLSEWQEKFLIFSLYFFFTSLRMIFSHPFKSPFLRDIVQTQYLANFLKYAQKSFHCSFEVIGCYSLKRVYNIPHHTLIKVATQSIIWLQVTYCWFYTCTFAEEFMFFQLLITAIWFPRNIGNHNLRPVNFLLAPKYLLIPKFSGANA